MRIARTVNELRRMLTGQRNAANLVPTMGNLHEGHLSLVRCMRARSGPVVVSIFVNRLQFAPHEDFATYPRTLERDCELLAQVGCDIVFAPEEKELYPEPQEFLVYPSALLADTLEGAVRPGFFRGVCTVVLKLLSVVRPAAAIFGKKDYQQALIIRSMVRQFLLPVKIILAETVRASSGLALSSRNSYLNGEHRAEAPLLYAVLAKTVASVKSGRVDWPTLEEDAAAALKVRGWSPDYVAIRRQHDLGPPSSNDPLLVLAAARLGGTRLIDNVEI
jgi:pantoate--beta-alanine ligase